MKDLRIELSFKNALLYNKLKEHFGEVHIVRASQQIGVSHQSLFGYLKLRNSPFNAKRKDLKYNKTARKIAEFLGVLVEDLFPIHLYKLSFPQIIEKDVDSQLFISLPEAYEQKLLPEHYDMEDDIIAEIDNQLILNKVNCKLSNRDLDIIEKRIIEETTLDDLGETYGKTRERIRQIEKATLKKLRRNLIFHNIKTFPQ